MTTPLRCALAILALGLAATAFADEEEFRPLFNGVDLDGWVRRGGEATYEVDADAEGGPQIVGTSVAGAPNSFLCTDRDYADFILEFEVKVDPAVNSGVQFRSAVYEKPTEVKVTDKRGATSRQTQPAGRVYGYQAEIDPSERAWSGGVYDEARRGWLHTLDGDENAEARAAFKPDGWNHYRVEAVGDHLSVEVNGVETSHLHDDGSATGFIALQVHSVQEPHQVGKQIRWRNIRLREVTDEEPVH